MIAPASDIAFSASVKAAQAARDAPAKRLEPAQRLLIEEIEP